MSSSPYPPPGHPYGPAQGTAPAPGPTPGPEPVWHGDGADHPVWGAPQQPQPPRRRKRGPWLVLALVLLTVLALGAGALMTLQSGRSALTSPTSGGGLPQPERAPQAPVVQADESAPDWSATAAAVSPSVVSISVETSGGGGEGSGVVLDSSGHVVTNHHVIAGAGTGGQIMVTLADQRVFEAKVVGSDAMTDLAVLALEGAPGDLRPITTGDDRQLKVGQPVMAIGNPLGLSGTVTTGIVSALNRPVVTTQDEESDSPLGSGSSGQNDVVTNAIQTSAAINPGNSGGALVDASGKLVGINSSIASTGPQAGNIGIGFAIPVTEAKNITRQLIETGKVAHPFLGVGLRDALAAEGSTKRRAAGIVSVEPGTPAASGGLKTGDAVVAIDGVTVDSARSLTAQVRARQVGAATTLTIVRDGQRQDIKVNLAQRR